MSVKPIQRRWMPLNPSASLLAFVVAKYTTKAMDRVKLGRALGYGVRHAAKTAVAAVEAATAPDPRAASQVNPVRAHSASATSPPGTPSSLPEIADRVAAARQTATQAGKHGRGLGRSVWSPLAKFSGVLWLEVTGTFFAVMALFLGQGVWRQRAALQLGIHAPEAQKLYVSAAAFLFFAYFAMSNFVRASRRGRR